MKMKPRGGIENKKKNISIKENDSKQNKHQFKE